MKHYGRQTCISCHSKEILPLILVDQDGIPPDQKGHELVYSHLMVLLCQTCGSGQVERLDHHSFDFEEFWDWYEWYVLDSSDMSQMRMILETCPHPLSPQCTCSIHHALRSACGTLPKKGWSSGGEDALHVHRVFLKVTEGLPRLALKA